MSPKNATFVPSQTSQADSESIKTESILACPIRSSLYHGSMQASLAGQWPSYLALKILQNQYLMTFCRMILPVEDTIECSFGPPPIESGF